MTGPVRVLWNRVRGLGRRVEDELYELSEEEREEEPRGRNTLVALLNAFLTIWKASQANVAERTLGLLGLGGLLWLIAGDRGREVHRTILRLAAATFAALWFVPGLIAALWTLGANLGVENLRRLRTWPLVLTFAAGGLISFRAVFSDLAHSRLRSLAVEGGDRHEGEASHR